MTLREKALELIKTSYSLQKAPLEKTYWEDKLERLNEEELGALLAILENEQAKFNLIQSERLNREIAANQEHLTVLSNMNHRLLPKAVKAAEAAVRERENPDHFLSAL